YIHYLCHISPYYRVSPSFPTRRSSDLQEVHAGRRRGGRTRESVAATEHHVRITGTAGDGREREPAELVVELLVGGQRRHRAGLRSEEHTSELQSRFDLVCRLLLEKKKY